MSSSGTTLFNPSVADFGLDAFERIGVYAPSLEAKHMHSLRRSTNLVVGRFALRGVNLWKVDVQPTLIDLIPGTPTYALDKNVVGMLDTYVRTPPNAPISTTSSTSGSIIPYLVGKPIAQIATFYTTEGESLVRVNQPGNDFTQGEYASIIYPVVVGGVTLGGVYTVISIIDADNFTIDAGYPATSTSQVTINGTIGTDIILTPISRNDYAAIPNKMNQGRPTSYWFERTITPQVTIWPVTDNTGPYQLQTYLMRQIEDANPAGAQTMNLPYRANYAFVAALAYDLALKFMPMLAPALKTEAAEAWSEFADEDIEHVAFFISPDFSGYG